MKIDIVAVGLLVGLTSLGFMACYAHICYRKGIALARIARALWETSPFRNLPAYLALTPPAFNPFCEYRDNVLRWFGRRNQAIQKLFQNLDNDYRGKTLGEVTEQVFVYLCGALGKKPEDIGPTEPKWLRKINFNYYRNLESDRMNTQSELRRMLDAMNGQDKTQQ